MFAPEKKTYTSVGSNFPTIIIKMFKKFRLKTIYPDVDAKMFWHFYIPQNKLCKALRERIKINKDSTILISGPTGTGKSTLIGKFCFNFFSELDNVKIEGEKMYTDDNFIIDPEVFAARMIADKGTALWIDEARDGLSSKNWNSQINKTIISRKNKNRKRGIVLFILLPYEKEVDKSFLNHVNMWIFVKKRGIGEIYVASNARKGGEGLSVQRIIDREAKWFKENPNRRVVNPTIHPEYIGSVVFGAFTKAEDKRYNALVDKHHAAGKLTEEEEEKLNPMMDKKEIEALIPSILDEVEKGEIKNKREMWEKLKELTKLEDAILIRYINRHLKIRGYKNFNSFEF